ncbi:MAG: hypothetical protein WAO58_09935 [Fimbriimonadaceae bacterium]
MRQAFRNKGGQGLGKVLGIGYWALAGGLIATAAYAQDSYWNPLPSSKATTKSGIEAVASREYLETIRKTASMAGNGDARQLASRLGLDILNVTWEDTGRYKGSSVGPNISDMTIQVAAKDPRSKQLSVTAMPVIRFPNFSDISADLDPRDFTLMVGNQAGRPLKRVSLYDFLKEPTRYLSNPGSWLARSKTLLAPRDTKVLVSAQACFLPIPQQGIASFNPVLFNYQSVSGDPAVLTILATREGTSVTVIDNKRDAFSTGSVWGQRLFFNNKGQRASFTGTRLSDFKASGGGRKGENEASLNMVLLIQVPLKQKNPMRFGGGGGGVAYDMAAPSSGAKMKRESSDVEAAVIGHGETEGPFTEIDNLSIQRDDRFPVRVTVQFYKATSNGVVSQGDMKEIKDQIDKVYALSDYVGSLVTEGETGRATEYDGIKIQPRDWWNEFWRRHEQNTGDDRWRASEKLRKLLGQNYMNKPVCDLYLRNLLKK